MADDAEVDERARDTSRRRNRMISWSIVVATFVIILVGTVVVVANKQDDKYGPIESGGFSGVAASTTIVSQDALGSYRLVTKGHQTAYVYSSMSNAGEHSVRITGIEGDRSTVRVQWAPLPRSESVAIPQYGAAWRDFPATITGAIQLRVEIKRPSYCRDRPMTPGSGVFHTDNYTVHWESLLGDHATMIGGGFDGSSVQVC